MSKEAMDEVASWRLPPSAKSIARALAYTALPGTMTCTVSFNGIVEATDLHRTTVTDWVARLRAAGCVRRSKGKIDPEKGCTENTYELVPQFGREIVLPPSRTERLRASRTERLPLAVQNGQGSRAAPPPWPSGTATLAVQNGQLKEEEISFEEISFEEDPPTPQNQNARNGTRKKPRKPKPRALWPAVQPAAPPDGTEQWRKIVAALQPELNEGTYNTWFPATLKEPVERQGDTLLISVPNDFFAGWLKEHEAQIHAAAHRIGLGILRMTYVPQEIVPAPGRKPAKSKAARAAPG